MNNGQTQQPQPALIINSDGSIEQLIPLSITFFEASVNRLAQHVETLKRQAVFSPPQAPQPKEMERMTE